MAISRKQVSFCVFIAGAWLAPGPAAPAADCNLNDIDDATDIESGASADCNGNGVPDECEVAPALDFAGATFIPISGSHFLDLDGDGDIDLLSFGRSDSGFIISLRVFTNSGNGTFAAPREIPIDLGGYPLSAVFGDVDGDGDPDVIASVGDNTAQCSNSVLENDGGRGFSPPVPIGNLSGIAVAAAGDLNSDGRDDLVLWDEKDSCSVSLNLGNKAFDVPNSLGSGFSSIRMGDLDGDGDQDLVVTSGWQENRQLLVLFNEGDGTFGASRNLGTFKWPALVLIDGDDDGDLDLLMQHSLGTIILFRNDGDGNLTPDGFPYDTGYILGAADLDGNGLDDVIWSTTGGISVLFHVKGSVFQGMSSFPVGQDPVALAAIDADGDGTRDLAVANNGSGTVSVLLGLGGGLYEKTADLDVGTRPVSLIAGDLDGDGDSDLAAANQGSENVTVIMSRGSGLFGMGLNYPVGSPGSQEQPIAMIAGDAEADGDLDLAVLTASGVRLLRNGGNGMFAGTDAIPTGAGPTCLAACDLDRDGALDLLVGNHDSGDVSLLFGGDAGFRGPNLAVGARPTHLATGDLDGDGNIDIAVGRLITPGEILDPMQASYSISLILHHGDGIFEKIADIPLKGLTLMASGDLDRDGRIDIVANAGRKVLVFSNGNLDFRPAARLLDMKFLAIEDLDGDGHLDLAVSSGQTQIATALIRVDPPAAPDCNANGIPDACDIAAGRETDGNANGVPDGCEGQVFRRGDLDGSGSLDLTDGIVILEFLYLGEAAPGCIDAADVNDDGATNLSDAIFSFSFQFMDGPPPPAPFPACGGDPSPDELTCAAPPPCR